MYPHIFFKENVEYCLFGDQTDRLRNVKTERYDLEKFNNNLRKKLNNHSEKVFYSITLKFYNLSFHLKIIFNPSKMDTTSGVRFKIFI